MSTFIVLVLFFSGSSYAQQADRIYAITFSYQTQTNILSLVEIREAIGSIDESSAGATYRLGVLSADDDILHSLNFNVEEQRGNPEIVEFSVFVPFYEEADHINVYDKDNNPVLSVSLRDAVAAKSGFGQLSPLSQERQISGSSSTPLSEKDKKFNFSIKWLYVAAPLVLIMGFLLFVELRRKSDHAQLLSKHQSQKADVLKTYVAANLRKGYSKDQIRNALLKNNYSVKEVDEALGR